MPSKLFRFRSPFTRWPLWLACLAAIWGLPRSLAQSSILDVPLRLSPAAEVSHAGWWVRGGVPFPRGVVSAGAGFEVLDEQGNRLPAQVNPTAWWPDGSMKWALVVSKVQLRKGRSPDMRLRVTAPGSSDSAAMESTGGVSVSESTDHVVVDTGRIRLVVPRRGPDLVSSARLRTEGGEREMLADSAGVRLFAELERHRDDVVETVAFEEDESLGASSRSVVVEESGPGRVVVRIQGGLSATTGEGFAPFTVRLRAHADSGLLEVVHSFVYDANPETDRLRAVGLRVHGGFERSNHYTLAGEHGTGHGINYDPTSNRPAWRRGVLEQNGSSHYRISKWIDPEANSPVRMEEGARSQGWGRLHGPDGVAIAVGVRNFWQEYPKALAIDAAEQSVTAYFYSPHGGALDLRRYADHTHSELYETSASGPEPAPLQPESDWIDYIGVEDLGARHIAKTSEAFIDFTAGDAADKTARDSRLFQSRPRLTASIEWIASTRALGDYAVAGDARIESLVPRLREAAEFLTTEPGNRRWYSFLDYGDLVHSYDPGRDHWRRDQGGYAWNNNEHGIAEGLWAAYLHNGDPALYEVAAAQTRHLGDVDMYHGGPLAGSGTRHNVNHYGCMAKKRRMTLPENKRVYYFLSGDERTRDLIHFIHDSFFENEVEAEAMRERRNTMDLGVYASALLFLWETTGEARYGELLRKTTEALCFDRIEGRGFRQYVRFDPATGDVAAPEGTGLALTKFRLNPSPNAPTREDPVQHAQTQSFLLRFGPMDMLLNSVELTGSDIVRQALLDWAELLHGESAEGRRYQKRFTPDLVCGRVAAYAWRETGDERYRDYLRSWLADPDIWFETTAETELSPARVVPRNGAPDSAPERRAEEKFQLRDMADLLRNAPEALEVLLR